MIFLEFGGVLFVFALVFGFSLCQFQTALCQTNVKFQLTRIRSNFGPKARFGEPTTLMPSIGRCRSRRDVCNTRIAQVTVNGALAFCRGSS